ncbi:MAG: hypothetical protein IJS60_09885 [Abditibacteriota bacterium]|nr:hypothetical protein [Abditibacteriota bacterium]
MKKILMLVIVLLLVIPVTFVFCNNNDIKDSNSGNTITNYLEINNMNQFYNWLSENKYDEFMEIYKSEFVPFTLIDEGKQVVFQKGMYTEGRDLKSTYIKEDSLTDFINKENLKFLSNKKIKLEKDGFIVAIYDIDDIITNQYLINKNIEKSLVDHLQLITIERNDNILWYTINETKTPSEELVKSNIELINTFKILDFVVLDKDSVIFLLL